YERQDGRPSSGLPMPQPTKQAMIVSRVYATLGNDHRLFGWLGHWQPGRRPPILSLVFQCIITLGVLFALTTEKGHNAIERFLTSDAVSRVFTALEITHESTWNPERGFDTLVSHT